MLKPLRRAAVRVVKPRVSAETWARLRAIDPQHTRRQRSLAVQRVDSAEQRAASSSAFGTATHFRPSLENLASEYRTDQWCKRRYAPHYERHFTQLRRTSFTLLEIGVGGGRESTGGASLRMWKHFFPKAQIVGLDLYDKSLVNEKRIITYQGSQTDADLLRSIARKHRQLKIIIDDGSHRPEHVRATFAILFPLVADGGCYAIEDTQTSYWPRFGGSVDLKDPATTMGMIKDLLDGLNHQEFGDLRARCYADSHVVAVYCYHNLVIIEKGRNAEGGNRPEDWAVASTGESGPNQ
jgi:hypothetical protein